MEKKLKTDSLKRILPQITLYQINKKTIIKINC